MANSIDLSETQKHPRQRFIEDLEAQILGWQEKLSCEVILCIDANDDLSKSYKGLSVLVDACQLINIHPDNVNTPTYSEGQNKIDHIFGTRGIARAMTQNGITGYATGIPSDHRGLFIDLFRSELFEKMNPLQSTVQRVLKCSNIERVSKYKMGLISRATQSQLLRRLKHLESMDDPAQIKTDLEQIDKEWTEMRLEAEEACGKRFNQTLWSFKLVQAGRILQCWKCQWHITKKRWKITRAFEELAIELGMPSTRVFISVSIIRKRIRKAEADLKAIKENA